MYRFYHLLAFAVVVSLMGCSGGDSAAEKTVDATEAAAEADTDHVWKEQVETIDRAKDVEKTIMESDAAKRKAMEDAGGG